MKYYLEVTGYSQHYTLYIGYNFHRNDTGLFYNARDAGGIIKQSHIEYIFNIFKKSHDLKNTIIKVGILEDDDF